MNEPNPLLDTLRSHVRDLEVRIAEAERDTQNRGNVLAAAIAAADKARDEGHVRRRPVMSVRDDYPEMGRIANGLGVLVLEDAEAEALRVLDEIAKWHGMHADLVRRSNAFAQALKTLGDMLPLAVATASDGGGL